MAAAARPTNDPAARVITQPQLSVSGTPRWRDDQTRPDDYVTELADPIRRMEIFEEMRASDEAVHTAIATRIALGMQANWLLSAPSDDDASRQILEFVEDNLYPVIDTLLRQLLEAVQYGVGVVEPVYAWADRPFTRQVRRGKIARSTIADRGRRIYLKKIASIRQRTIQSFLVTLEGELRGIRQHVFTGAQFRVVDIPAEKLLIWTVDRRGDDYWGQPPTRFVYKAWTFKNQIERLNLLGLDRFGVGTPVAVAGEGWSDAEYVRLERYLATWRAGQGSYLITPFGGTVDIKGGQGALIAAVLDIIKFYAVNISKAYLTQGSDLASATDTGARALGETFYDQSAGIVQAEIEQIAEILNEQLIVPLVDINFGPQDAYPTFSPSERVKQSPAIGQLIATLVAAKAIHCTPQDEAWLRDAIGMPAIALDELVAADEERQATADAIANAVGAGAADPSADPASPPNGAARRVGHRRPRVAARVACSRARSPARRPRPRRAARPTAARRGRRGRAAWSSRTRSRSCSTSRRRRTAAEVQQVLLEIDAGSRRPGARPDRRRRRRARERDRHDPRAGRVPPRAPHDARSPRPSARATTGKLAVQSEVDRQRTPDIAAPARYSRAARASRREQLATPARWRASARRMMARATCSCARGGSRRRGRVRAPRGLGPQRRARRAGHRADRGRGHARPDRGGARRRARSRSSRPAATTARSGRRQRRLRHGPRGRRRRDRDREPDAPGRDGLLGGAGLRHVRRVREVGRRRVPDRLRHDGAREREGAEPELRRHHQALPLHLDLCHRRGGAEHRRPREGLHHAAADEAPRAIGLLPEPPMSERALHLHAGHFLSGGNVQPDGTLWSHAATMGDFVKGSAFTINRATLASFVKNFTSGYPAKVPIDYEHETADKRIAQTESVPWTRKAGDVVELAAVLSEADLTPAMRKVVADDRARRTELGITRPVDPTGLWVRWVPTARALSLVSARELNDMSITFGDADDAQGNPQGPTIFSIALTNTPFLGGMVSVAASRGDGGSPAGPGQEITPMSTTTTQPSRVRLALSALLGKPIETDEEIERETTAHVQKLGREIETLKPAQTFREILSAEFGGEQDPAKVLGSIRQLKHDLAAAQAAAGSSQKTAVEAQVATILAAHEKKIASVPLRTHLAAQLTANLTAGQKAGETDTEKLLGSMPIVSTLGQKAGADTGGALGSSDEARDAKIALRAKELLATDDTLKALAKDRGHSTAFRSAVLQAGRELAAGATGATVTA
jgi:hypothetical protein